MQRILIRLLSLAMALTLSGCAAVTFRVANAPAVFGNYRVTRDIHYGENVRQRLDVYVPAEVAAAQPVVVFFYGGGWTDGEKGNYRFVGDALTSRGFIVVIANYRLYPEAKFPVFVADGAAAVAWVHAHAGDIGGDPRRVFLMGHSAGAQIAALLAFDPKYLAAVGGNASWLSGFIGLAGPYDFLPLRDPVLEDIFGPDARYAESQPVNFVGAQPLRSLLMHGEADTVVRPSNTRSLAAKLRAQGGSVRDLYFEGVKHTGVLSPLSRYLRNRHHVLDEIGQFITSSTPTAQKVRP